MTAETFPLFAVWGIEIEFMIVDGDSLDVRAIADEVLREGAAADAWVEDVQDGDIGWSNELVSHVLELKNAEPVPSLEGIAEKFEASVRRLNGLLEGHGARLMPAAMHPWMDPARETRLWPHESAPIYRAYDELFDCRRHGWANLQSVHLNLPFSTEQEFARLMAAIRLVLPLIPALAASSPVMDGRATGLLDNRLEVYRTNGKRAPSMTGDVVPEPIYGYDAYRAEVLAPIKRELRAIGAEPALLEREWTNARGAIARFDRMAIEIRVIDSQECPLADLGVAAAVGGAVRALVEERWAPFRVQRDWPGRPLIDLLGRTIATGPLAALDARYVEAFGVDRHDAETAGDLWKRLTESAFAGPVELEGAVDVILRQGTLAQRLLTALDGKLDRASLRVVYRELCECLATGRSFRS